MTAPLVGDGSEPTGKPNVLCIITDQHRADHVGFMDNDVVRTPNLDALAMPDDARGAPVR